MAIARFYILLIDYGKIMEKLRLCSKRHLTLRYSRSDELHVNIMLNIIIIYYLVMKWLNELHDVF